MAMPIQAIPVHKALFSRGNELGGNLQLLQQSLAVRGHHRQAAGQLPVEALLGLQRKFAQKDVVLLGYDAMQLTQCLEHRGNIDAGQDKELAAPWQGQHAHTVALAQHQHAHRIVTRISRTKDCSATRTKRRMVYPWLHHGMTTQLGAMEQCGEIGLCRRQRPMDDGQHGTNERIEATKPQRDACNTDHVLYRIKGWQEGLQRHFRP